ncbi:sodium/potassium/calcium exchanger 3 isoform X2 [Plutella xylostella]|uniref:sodium/potassium/calcium exchanger 3 isoform X2 n=1 Tax=Plutella xylostella TaxID=51655 RepID=UPI0020328668|nr:sodium/potassium/calcium exchanger 3 isoform X2 [Plutella xylostella]
MAKGTAMYSVLFLATLYVSTAQGLYNDSTRDYVGIERHGLQVSISRELLLRIESQDQDWHFLPWMRIRTTVVNDTVTEVSCLSGDSIDSFPDGLFDDEQLRRGGFILYMMLGIYAFTLLAFVCNDYFIPTVEIICDTLKIPQNVAAATFMAVATSCPEFFVNVISTFLTESDMGIGTIVGSAVFNALGVAAIGGLAAIRPISIEMRPVTRDVCIYLINVSVLVAIVFDGQIAWYEATVLGVMYVCYFLIMFNSVRLFALADRLTDRWRNRNKDVADIQRGEKEGEKEIEAQPELVFNGLGNNKVIDDFTKGVADVTVEEEEQESLWAYPSDKKLMYQAWWLYCFPVKFLLTMTIPSPVTRKKWWPLTFIMCIVWIGGNSYFVTWSMTVLGHTFFIPDSVMGMTFLAFGGCLPEACAIFIMSRKGEGGIGVSNALGANSLAILFALGMPWLIRTLTLLSQGAEAVVYINSSGIEFIVGSLLIAVISLWVTLYFGKFVLRRLTGSIFLCLYVIFITLALLIETGVILDKAIPLC